MQARDSSRRQQLLFALIFFLGAFLGNTVYGAEENLSSPKVMAVQSIKYYLSDELTLQAGYLPLDSFNRYLSYGGSYTHYFNKYEGWELLNINKAINYDTGLNNQIQQSFNFSAYPFNTLDYDITSNFIYTPLFNKSLMGGNSIVLGETELVAGWGLAKFDDGFTNEIDLGTIFRFFIGDRTSLKFDVRYHFYFDPNSMNNLQLSIGFAYNFTNEDTEEQRAKDLKESKDSKDAENED
jgi:outer membrane beta-barrel protein